jgi:tetratricopeptide (TPR) repeat protein
MIGSRRAWYILPLAVSGIVIVVGAVLGITTNLASDVIKFPHWLAFVPHHPVAATGVLAVFLIGLNIIAYFSSQAGPQPATEDDLADAAEGLHDRFDRLEIGQLEGDGRVLDRLPPFAKQLLSLDVDHESTWQLIVVFARETVDPYRVAREWSVAPPSAAAALSADGQLIIAEILLAYQQPKAAVQFLIAALELGASPRPLWLLRAAQAAMTAEDEEAALGFLDQAQHIDPDYSLATAFRLNMETDWKSAARAITGFRPRTDWE